MRPVFKTILLILSFTILISLVSCGAAGSSIISGKVKTAIDPSEVKIYLEAPSQYETIGIVEATADIDFSRQSAQDNVIAKLKSLAAKNGANGVLLVTTGSQSSGTTGLYSNGIFVSGTSNKINGQGKAIYVTKE